jgi:hypothetical protein
MSRSSFPQRAVRPKLLPGFSFWSAAVGVLLSGISLILTGNSDLNWWTKVGLCLISLVAPILVYVIWKNASVIWQRLKQYDLLYDELERTASNNQQLQENFTFILQTLISFAGLRVFKVTGIEWGNISPLLVIACNQQGLVGSKLVVINVSTLDTLGRFEVVQATVGGYLAREDRIVNAVWWGLLHEEIAKYAHPRIVNAVAVLLR